MGPRARCGPIMGNPMLELVLRFLLVGAVAFGGGQAALPLIERIAVAETGWLTPTELSVGIGLAYATPGPVLILAAYVGYYVKGLIGAVAATAAVFTVPVTLAAAAAQLVARLKASGWFRTFGRFASAATVGLLGITLFSLGRSLFDIHPGLLFGAAVVFAADQRQLSPVLIMAVAAFVGGVVGGVGL